MKNRSDSIIQQLDKLYDEQIKPYENDRDHWEECLAKYDSDADEAKSEEAQEESRFYAELSRLFLNDPIQSSLNVGFVGETYKNIQRDDKQAMAKVRQSYFLLRALQRYGLVRSLYLTGARVQGELRFNLEMQDILTKRLTFNYEKISFGYFDFDDNFSSGMMSLLPIEKPVKHLCFKHCYMTNMQFFARPEIMETVETLSFESCVIYDTTDLPKLIGLAKNLKSLTFKYMKLNEHVEFQIAKVLRSHGTLEHLEMERVLSNDGSLSAFLKELGGSERLKHLEIKQGEFTAKAAEMLEDMLAKNKSLVEVDISSFPLIEKSAEQNNAHCVQTDITTWGRTNNFSLEKINLHLINGKSAIPSLKLINGCSGLQSLRMSSPDLGAAFTKIPNSYIIFRYLFEINFNYCGLRSGDMYAIRSLLIASSCINTLRLEGNLIDGGVSVIAGGVKSNHSLAYLCLPNIHYMHEDNQALNALAVLKPHLLIFTGWSSPMDYNFIEVEKRRKKLSVQLGFDPEKATMQDVKDFLDRDDATDSDRELIKRLIFVGPNIWRKIREEPTPPDASPSNPEPSRQGNRTCIIM